MNIRGMLFDCDGLLVGLEQLWLETLTAYAATFGVSLDALAYMGLTNEQASVRLVADLGGDEREIFGAVTAQFSARVSEGIAALPGVGEFLERYAGLVPCAVVSNGLREDVTRLITGAGLARYFSAMVCAGEAPRAKPYPDPYLLGAASIGVEAGACVVFEDSPVGCAAGRAAGCTVIGVQAAAIDLPCDVRVASFEQLDDASLQEFGLRFP